jgi:hypothetical protein
VVATTTATTGGSSTVGTVSGTGGMGQLDGGAPMEFGGAPNLGTSGVSATSPSTSVEVLPPSEPVVE